MSDKRVELKELRKDTSTEFAKKVETLYKDQIVNEFSENEYSLINKLRCESNSIGEFVARAQEADFSEFKIGFIIGSFKWMIIYNKALKVIVEESNRLGRMLTSEETNEIIKDIEFDRK